MLLKRIIWAAVFIFCPVHVFSKSVLPNKTSEQDLIPCEKGWYIFGEKCYKVAGKKKSGRMSWDRAETRCKRDGGTLASIHSQEEFDFIVSFLLLDLKANAWIGLHDRANESDYTWSDGSEVNYTNWKPMEPSGPSKPDEDCVHMFFEPENDIIGPWNDISCNREFAYVCQMNINQRKQSPNPAYCASGVGGGWKYQSSCYHVVTDKKSWGSAEQYCTDNFNNGHLVTVLDTTVDLFLDHIYVNKEFWIGINIQVQLQQKWTSGWHVSYSGMNKEHGDFVEGTCVVRKKRNMWTMTPCAKNYTFVCEVSQVSPPVLKLSTENSHCPEHPDDWRDLDGDYCYYIETKAARSWYEANFDCIRRGGSLLSLHSEEETRTLLPFIKYTQFNVHIGLFRQLNNAEHFAWADGSGKPGYENWSHDEPNNDQVNCVDVLTSDMTWDDQDCTNKKGYICSAKKIVPNITKTEETTDCSGHISFKALIGVSICIILVIILFGVVMYYFRRWDGERRKNSTQVSIPTPSPRDRPRYRSTTELTVKEEDNNYELML